MKPLSSLIELEQQCQEFGFYWPDHLMILEQIIDECREIKEAIDKKASREEIQEEIGDLLHAVISLCEFCDFDVEGTVEKANAKFAKRVMLLKEVTKKHGLNNLQGQNIEFKLAIWKEVKALEKTIHPK